MNLEKFIWEPKCYDGVDITWSIWDDNFIPYYNEIMIYIDNRN
jgi:hypothetical protein